MERVVKGTVGPVLFAGREAPGELGALMAQQEQGFVAAFPLDMAACDLAADRDNDPLEDPMVASLSGEAKGEYEKAREGMGYRVFKDRKFVVSANLQQTIRNWCNQSNTKNIIKVVRGPRR